MWPFKPKQQNFPELRDELLILCREWFERQIGDLLKEELPPQEEIEEDILQMRDETYARIISSVPVDKYLHKSKSPDDETNRLSLKGLVEAYAGHEATTPIFTKLALSKIDEPRYQSGWPLFAIRVVAETYLEQSIA